MLFPLLWVNQYTSEFPNFCLCKNNARFFPWLPLFKFKSCDTTFWQNDQIILLGYFQFLWEMLILFKCQPIQFSFVKTVFDSFLT